MAVVVVEVVLRLAALPLAQLLAHSHGAPRASFLHQRCTASLLPLLLLAALLPLPLLLPPPLLHFLLLLLLRPLPLARPCPVHCTMLPR